jgi:hypothetical protein
VFDAMKIYAPALLLLLLAFPSLSSWAGETPEGSVPRKSASQESLKANAIYDDFKNRLEVALASRELAAVAALYRTNDVTAVELKSELARWQQPVAEGAKATPPYLKTLSELPPESHDYWEAQAHRVTRHKVTHFALVGYIVRGERILRQETLPLVLVGNRLLIVPSEKIADQGIEPGGAMNRSQPIRSDTNRPSAAAGSGR